MSRRFGPAVLPADEVTGHPATQAWASLSGSGGEVRSITMLTQRNKAAVYRVGLTGWTRPTVIAKSCSARYGIEG
jgi:hypothetical protein